MSDQAHRRGIFGIGWLLRRLLRIIVYVVFGWAAAVVILSVLYLVIPPVSTLMVGDWLRGRAVQRNYVQLQQISPQLPLAVLTSEDSRFCSHFGVDWDALNDVIESAGEDGPRRGASTIAMQTAKNLFLLPSRSYIRKGLEVPLALYLDALWSKRRMMEIYLNIAEWGNGIYGAEAAARYYFNKSARNLTRREATLLATALPNPIRRNPGNPTRGHQALAERLSVRMNIEGPVDSCL